jgi:hypothetical protein
MVEGDLRIVVQAAVRMRVERGSCSRVEDGKHGVEEKEESRDGDEGKHTS